MCAYPTWDEIGNGNRLHVVFICFVPNTGTRFVIMDVSVAMHGRQDSTTSDRVILANARVYFWLSL